MDRALQLAAPINYKRCTSCRKAMDTHSSYKTCKSCRAKDKAKRERQTLKIRQQHMTVQANTNLNPKYDATGGSSKKERQENATHSDGSQKPSAGAKRKAQKSPYELEGEVRKVALKKAKGSLMEMINRQGKKPLPTTNVKSVENDHEYLNASSLYDSLKSKAFSSYPVSKNGNRFLQFHGSHSIVAVSYINNIKRINIVVNDLRKIARLSFAPDAISSRGPSGSVTLSYPCNCIGYTPAVAPPLVDKLNGAGSLDKWARARTKVASGANQAVARSCGGKVNVTVLDDETHSLKILGQQIIVRVEHPNV